MIYRTTVVALLGATVALSACSGGGRSAVSSSSQIASMPALGSSAFVVDPIRPGAPTGTFVGQKVQQLRGDLVQLQQSIRQHSDQLQGLRGQAVQDASSYYAIVASINARLQVGTTPGNPVLLQTWNQAQAQLNQMDGNIAQMNDLGNRLATSAALARYLSDAVASAFYIPGAVDEDHRQLAMLRGEVEQTAVVVERVAAEVNADISRQRNYIASERQSLNGLAQSIKQGELYGSASYGMAATPAFAAPYGRDAYAAAPAAESRRPLVIIRFDRPDVAFEQPLYTALSQALERRPSAVFDVVAVAPIAGRGASAATAKRNAERVLRSVTEMGLPPDRVRLSASNSPETDVTEVHVYVR